jgi:hypothetical protein
MTFPFFEHPGHAAPEREICIFGPEYWDLMTSPDGEGVTANDKRPFNFPRVKGWQHSVKGRTSPG